MLRSHMMRESGRGVKLIKKTDTKLLEYLNCSWRTISAEDTKYGLKLFGAFGSRFFVLTGMLTLALSFLLLALSQSLIYVVISLWIAAFGIYIS